MKNYSILILILIFGFKLKAQVETLFSLKTNANLYYQTIEYQNTAKKEFIEDNIIITSDSLSLPFIDDFSINTLRPYNFNEVIVNDTIQYATGSCIDDQFSTENVGFMNTQSYYYFYDTINDILDSVTLASVSVYVYSNTNCFPVENIISTYYPSYYKSVLADFNTTTGTKLDSTLVTPDLTIDVATIYFATMPSNVKWMDNFAWWNTTNPVDPITIGVATLDGLNQFGLPYNTSVTNAYGQADYLTSKPIDLSLLGLTDNVYLSFFYQAGGLGDNPNESDSLIVEFRGLDGEWTQKWSKEGIDADNFKQVYIPIYETTFDSLIYSNTEFQFRFKNLASLSGNNDWWNIDYVRLDKNRNPNSIDSVISDVSFLYDFPNYLKNYSMLPWDQMQAGTDEFTDTIKIPIRDNGQVQGLSAGNFPIDILISNSISLDLIYTETGSNFNTELGQEIKEHKVLSASNFSLPTFTSDSVHFISDMYISAVSSNVELENDTIKNEILFDNIIAYDDGSAERAYGLNGGGTEVKKFAYEFNISTQDTLAAIQIHFSNIDRNVENLVFSLYAWDSISLSSSYDHIIGSIENKKPEYIDYKNGYATFVFDTPIIVQNKFYIGWAQTDNRNLQIGYDLNSTKGREHMYVFTSNTWNPSSIGIEGSVMIRAILDGDYPIPTVNTLVDIEKEYIKVYPNPTSNTLNIEIPPSLIDYELVILDISGKQLFFDQNINKIDVSNYTKGIYFLSIINIENGNKYSSRFIVK